MPGHSNNKRNSENNFLKKINNTYNNSNTRAWFAPEIGKEREREREFAGQKFMYIYMLARVYIPFGRGQRLRCRNDPSLPDRHSSVERRRRQQ